jgi:membrane protein implicated in regulation of membrane protease activity
VVGWWSVPAFVAGYAGMLFLPYSAPILPALGVLPLMAVLAVTGWRVLARVSAERASQR